MKINNILVTGCGSGLGHAIALRLSRAGCHIYAVGRDKRSLEQLSAASQNIHTITADIATYEGRKTITKLINKNNSLSIIHNAAIAIPGLFNSLSEDNFLKHFEINYFAPMLLTQHILPLLANGQRVLHITSGSASMALPGLMPYCTSKAALKHATHCLNMELNSQEIYFANLLPGMIVTPIQSSFRNAEEHDLPNKEFYIHSEKIIN